ncbi:MAG: PEGA domain-containing protein [Myxococcales bacterium]
MHRLRTRTLTALAFGALLLLPALNALGQTVLEPRPVRKGYKRVFTINSTPQTATIYLDDRKYGVVGYTPFKVTLTDGDYKLILELKGYKTEERTLRVQKGIGEQLVVLQREVAPGTVRIMANDPSVSGAFIAVDGQVQGAAPRDVKLAVGRHQVELTREGYLPFQQWVEVEEGQVVALAPTLKPVVAEKPMGSLLVDSSPNGADVAIDGRKLADKTPTVVDGLTEGVHLVEITKGTLKPYKDTVFVKGGERTKLSAPLEDPEAQRLAAEKVAAERAAAEKAAADKLAADRAAFEKAVADRAAADKAASDKAAADRAAADKAAADKTAADKAAADKAAAAPTTRPMALTVRANIDGAEVLIDGARKGLTPLSLAELAIGPHTVEVRAPDRTAETRRIVVEAGKPVALDVFLAVLDRANKGLVRVVSPQPEAAVWIDGAKAGVSPVEKDLSAGKHFIMVRKDGFADFNKEITVIAGTTTDLTANLLPGGGIRVIASKDGAKVMLDGKPIGMSPAEANNIEAGEHVVSVELAGFEEYRSKVVVNGGERAVVNADLKIKYSGPSKEELRIKQRAISTWSARPMPFGNFALDLSGGYPTWGELRATVGVSDANVFGWDLGLGLKSYTNNWDIYLTARTRFLQAGPFSLGAFGAVGGGAGMYGRNSAMGQVGALASINLADVFTISARFFGDFWSDQLCASEEPKNGVYAPGMEVCRAPTSSMSEARQDRIKGLFGKEDPNYPEDLRERLRKERNTGARFYLSLVLEGAITQHFSLFLIVEGSPGATERLMHTEVFNSRMFAADQIYNGRLGFTFKY